jgi:S1-C subfamily serine protease
MRLLAGAILTLFAAVSLARPRALPDDNLAYPVHLAWSKGSASGSASGFFLNGSDGTTYFVTAKHVLFDDAGTLVADEVVLTSYSRDPKVLEPNVIHLDLKTMSTLGYVRPHKTRDVLVLKVATGDSFRPGKDTDVHMVGGVRFRAMARTGILGAASDTLTRYDDVLVGNEVFVFGYPTSIGLTLPPPQVPQLDPSRPLIRKGIVAGLNPSLRTIILDCPIYLGNSGGPVLQVEDLGLSNKRFLIIGVISEFVPYVDKWINQNLRYENLNIGNSGYSVATPADYILELLAPQ